MKQSHCAREKVESGESEVKPQQSSTELTETNAALLFVDSKKQNKTSFNVETQHWLQRLSSLLFRDIPQQLTALAQVCSLHTCKVPKYLNAMRGTMCHLTNHKHCTVRLLWSDWDRFSQPDTRIRFPTL